MELNEKSYPEQAKLFRERTGKDFTELYKKYYPKLIYYTSKICNDVQKAEDISTDSFITALQKIHKYDIEKAQFSTWLFTIARNIAFQDIKIENRSISLDIEFDDEGTTMKDFIQEQESNEGEHVIYAQKADIIKGYISGLKEPYKSVIRMREIDKMTYKDIAIDMGSDVEFSINIESKDIGEVYILPLEISEIYSVYDQFGEIISDYRLVEGDPQKTPFITGIKLYTTGEYKISARSPKSLSTIKSQIRNGRKILIDKSKKEFELIDRMLMN